MKKQHRNHLLYLCIQWTWGMPQNLLGLLVWLFLRLFRRHCLQEPYHGAILTHWDLQSSMGLGMFVFLGCNCTEDSIRVHEYGHTLQSCLLGPLFLPVIGVPSFLWAMLYTGIQKRSTPKYSYYGFYPESWANALGERALHQPAPQGNRQNRH